MTDRDEEMLAVVEAEMQVAEAIRMFHMVIRQAQAAYAAGLRDGPQACMVWLGNALVGPGNLPEPGADPGWYAAAAWAEGPPWPEPPPANRTVVDNDWTPREGAA